MTSQPTQPTSPPVAPPRFYSVPEAARLIGTAPVTLYRAIRAREFPAVRIRGRLIVPAQALEAMIETALAEQDVVDAATWVQVPAQPGRKP